MKKSYPINERTLFNYKTNQIDQLMNGSKLNKAGYPDFWPTRNEDNFVVAVSFVNAKIVDENGKEIVSEPTTFDLLESDTFDINKKDALLKVQFLAALVSKHLTVTGGVYVKGKYYSKSEKKRMNNILYKDLMTKYFFCEDSEVIEKYLEKDEDGYFPYWPIKSKKYQIRVIFAAFNASIYDTQTKTVVQDNINFVLTQGYVFNLNSATDKRNADTIFALLNTRYIVKGFYYRGEMISKKISKSLKLYFEKAFIKNNFSLEHISYLLTKATVNENGYLFYYPSKDKDGKKIVVSFRDGVTPFGKEYTSFDISSDDFFDARLLKNQYYVQIIEGILTKNKMFSGALYLDSVLLPEKETYSEIQRRKQKVEKALSALINGNPDFIDINNKFKTNDREALVGMSNLSRTTYPNFEGSVPKFTKKYNRKTKENTVIFDNVNILDLNGNHIFKENYNACYSTDEYKPNEIELNIIKEMVKKHSLVRGGVYFKGFNFNRDLNKIGLLLLKKFLHNKVSSDDLHVITTNFGRYGCPYEMDKKSGMPKHWPVVDKDGKEVLLSVVDADIWFKVRKKIVKACNNMNFDIYSGETFGLVGESGSGKTTISRGILGINKLRKGGIYWKGCLISSGLNRKQTKQIKKSIQMIFQDPSASLNERANIDYIVSEGLYSFHLFKNTEERLTKVNKMMREVGLLPEHLSRYPHEFSGGQRQRIGIARALVIEPELVLADEPISALDVSIRAQVLNLLKKLQHTQNLTYLFIAHDLSIIRYISDRIAVMHNGFVVELGPGEKIYSNPLHPYTQSLLTAIPQPDPKTKDTRIRISYEQGDIDYNECIWKEILPGHYVLVNDKILEMINIK